ncbi:hypothetical protein GCM10010207_38840 [Streptomyces atratus]|nr:hypothetical protein GCM10010207_38840 [Streptomyces atratus]
MADPAAVAGGDQRQQDRARHPAHRLCRALGVSESWFHKWCDRRPTVRELRRQRLANEIKEIFILLVRKGWRVSMNTVAKPMAELGLVAGAVRRRSGLARPGKRPAAPDFVQRDFTAEEPDLAWAGDTTEIATEEGKPYLATVIDLFSRRLLSYAMSAHHDADLVVAALNIAAATRSGDVRGVMFHSDRGSEGGFNGSSQHLIVEVLHGKTSGMDDDVDGASGDVFAGAASGPSGCGAGVLGEDRRGPDSEDAAIACSVSGPVGSRWFRERGGMPSIQLSPPSGRYLSFAEREEIALLMAQGEGCARSRVGWAGHRRPSRGSCGAT